MKVLPPTLSWQALTAIAAVLLLCLAGWMYIDSRQTVGQLQRRIATAERALQHAEEKLASTRAAADAYAAVHSSWASIVSAGLLDAFTAQAWLQHARAALATAGSVAAISLLPQHAAASPPASAGSLLAQHSFRVDAQLRHEGQLTALLDQLRQLPGAVLLPRSCTLTRQTTTARAKVHARCTVDALQLARIAAEER